MGSQMDDFLEPAGPWPSGEELDRAEAALRAETGLPEEEIEVGKEHCVCGDRIDNHIAMDCGHLPVSMWDYSVFRKAQEMMRDERG